MGKNEGIDVGFGKTNDFSSEEEEESKKYICIEHGLFL
jgi:hypothetical protein